jgi:hypothetical protein
MSAPIPVFSPRPSAASTPKLRALVKFPGNLVGTTGIEVSKENGTWTVETDWNDFGAINAIPTSPTSFILTFDTATQAYVLCPSHLLGGAVAGIADVTLPGTYARQIGAWVPVVVPAITDDAPHDGFQYARQNGNWTVVTDAGAALITRVITNSFPVTVAATDSVIAFNQTTPTNVNVTLPAVAARNGLILSIEDIKGTAASNPIAILPNGSEKIDGLSSITLGNAFGFFTLRPYTGVGWKIINSA